MKLKIINLAAIMLCCSAQASVQVQNSRGEPVGAPAQSVQQSSVQDLPGTSPFPLSSDGCNLLSISTAHYSRSFAD